MLDRTGLSKMNGWLDENGEVYIYYKIVDICEKLGCCKNKAAKSVAELENAGLLRKIKRGLGEPVRYYVKNLFQGHGEGNRNLAKEETGFSREKKQEAHGMSPNNTEKNKTEFNNTENLLPCGFADEEEIRENIGYDYLVTVENRDMVDSVLRLICETVRSRQKNIRIGAELCPAETVKEKLLSLDSDHVSYVLGLMCSAKTEIRDVRAYMLKLLFTAPESMEMYDSMRFARDFPQ